jgi:hypothetical protein
VTTQDFITELFCGVDSQMKDMPKHSQAGLYPSEIATLAFMFAIKGVGNRPFHCWLVRDNVSLNSGRVISFFEPCGHALSGEAESARQSTQTAALIVGAKDALTLLPV